MLLRARTLFIVGALLGSPLWGLAQVSHPDDTETIQAVAGRKVAAEQLDLTGVAQSITRQTNALREEEKAAPVKPNAKLTAAAQYFADYMAQHDRYGHAADGNSPAGRATKHGYEYCLISENIAYQYSSAGFTADALARGLYEGWRNSPGHRKNMVDPDVTETGVAIARSPETGYYYAVQLFGRPKSAAIEFSIANQSGQAVEYQIGGRTFPLSPNLIRTHRRCRAADVQFRWPGSDEAAQTVRPETGARLTVVEERGALQLRQE